MTPSKRSVWALALGCAVLIAVYTLRRREESAPFACAVSALSPTERARSRHLRAALAKLVDHVDETPDGYRFWYQAEPGVLEMLAQWIALEHRCCPFLAFDLGWPLRAPRPFLFISGDPGVKAFLKAELPEIPSLASDD